MKLFNRHVDERLSEYIDGRLAPAEAVRFEAHVADCADCADELSGMRRAISALKTLPEVDVPRSFAINEAMIQPVVAAYRAPRWQAFAAPAAGMAVIFFLLLGGDVATSIDSEDDEDVVEDAASEQLLQTDALATEQDTAGSEAPAEGADDSGLTGEQRAEEDAEEEFDEASPLADPDGATDADDGDSAPLPSPDEETIERLQDVDEDDDDFRFFVRLIEGLLALGALALGFLAFRRWRAAN
jgi:anti-sigma factor RsiW